MKNTRVFLSKNKLNEETGVPELKFNVKDIEKEAKFLRYQYNLDDPNDSYYAALEFFDSDDWYEFRNLIRNALEELDKLFDTRDVLHNPGFERTCKLTTKELINIWNGFADLAFRLYQESLESDDRDAYRVATSALDTDGWAIVNIPHSIISKMVEL